MASLILFFKGIAIGIANVVAGLSGGTIAVICKVYDALIDFITTFFRHPIKAVKKHWRLIVGMVVGLIGGALILKRLYSFAPLPISLLFSGIVIASLIPMLKNVFKEKSKVTNYILFGIAVVLLIAIPCITNSSDKNLELNLKGIFILLGLGIISAASMIIPGVSGSMVLASFGYYESILGLVSDFVSKIVHFETTGLGTLIGEIIFFALGCIIGVVACALLIKKLFTRIATAMNFIITGLVAGSSIAMIIVVLINKENRYLFNTTKGLIMWIVGVILFGAGFYFGYYLNKMGEKNKMTFDDKYFDEKSHEYTDIWKNLTKSLVKFPSVLEEYQPNSQAPFGQANKEALEWMLNKAKEDGFETLNSDNYAGHVAYGSGDETLGLLAHLDVVPAVGNWTHDPFDVVEKDGKLFGRGVNDDKGPLAATYCALKLLKDAGFVPRKRILLIMGCDEESGSRCLSHYFSKNPMPKFGFSPDACYPCINGEKAHISYDIKGKLRDTHITSMYAGERYNIVPDLCYATFDIDLSKEFNEFLNDNNYKGEIKDNTYFTYGISAHAMSPEKGLNAMFIMFKFINKYAPCKLSEFVVKYLTDDPFGKKLGINVYHDEMKDLTENVAIIRIEDENVFIGTDCRVPVDNHESVMKTQIEKALEGTGLELILGDIGKTHYVPKDSSLVSTLMKAYRTYTNDYENDAYSIGGGTYAKFIDNAVAFGPQFIGREDVDHQTDEYVFIDDYTKSIAIYAKAIYELTK